MASEEPDPTEATSHQDDDILEHALLESLFYNEMAMMEGEWASDPAVGTGTPLVSTPQPSDPAEKEILDKFGVNENPNVHASKPLPSISSSVVTDPAIGAVPDAPVVSSGAATKTSIIFPPPQSQQNLPTITKSRGIKHNVQVPLATQPLQQQPPAQTPSQPASRLSPLPLAKDRTKLVGQFATLAERLGITIPNELLNRLNSTNATTNEAAAPVVTTTAAPAATLAPTTTSTKRPSITLGSTATTTSRRRKKPRLHECERRLAELQAENERLKRHLDLVSNRSRQAQVERVEAETKMRQLLQEGAPDSDLQPLLHSFQEMYSDYGKKRFEELEFHLEQLQRLAKPADFTKMGLWTLSGQSNNPRHSLSSLLLNELSITPPQSRKIMEQREKIRSVCDNLKEVSKKMLFL